MNIKIDNQRGILSATNFYVKIRIMHIIQFVPICNNFYKTISKHLLIAFKLRISTFTCLKCNKFNLVNF